MLILQLWKNYQIFRDSKMVQKVGIEIMLLVKKGFLNHKGESWIMIKPSVCYVCAHAGELFEINAGKSISVQSESPVESWNKYVRAYQSGVLTRAHQSSIKNNLKYVITKG